MIPTHLTLLAILGLTSAASAITIAIDYSHDAAGKNYFGANATARATLERAAADLSAVLSNGQLSAFTEDRFTGSDGGMFATADLGFRVTNPDDGSIVDYPDPENLGIAADEIRIFVGWRTLADDVLGQGGLAGTTLSSSYTDPTTLQAVENMAALANPAYTRGGPALRTFNYTTATELAETPIHVGPVLGQLWFDSDIDNDTVDDPLALDTYWHFDANTDVGAGLHDFYSVALHELIHAIGIGHLPEGMMSTRIDDGSPQEVAMDPNILIGTRKYLTEADVQAIAAQGYLVVPEPSVALLGLLSLLSCTARRKR